MIIKSVTYENFRNFKERGQIECSTDGKVTIIYGNNGDGKTTFHQLFKWIIYGKVSFNEISDDILYNLELQNDAKYGEQFKVIGIIECEHENINYEIHRECLYEKGILDSKKISEKFAVQKQMPDLDWKYLPKPLDFIEEVLPIGLSEYFFFDGERMISDLVKKSKRSAKKLKDALYQIFGLKVYENAIEYFGELDGNKNSVLGILSASKANDDTASAELKEAGKKMESARLRKLAREEEERQNNEIIETNKEIIKQLSEKIGKAKSQEEYEKIRENCKKEVESYTDLISEKYVQFGEEISSVFPKLLISKVVEKASLTIKKEANKASFVNGVNKTLIDELLKVDRCICGNCISDIEKKNLSEIYNLLPPHGYDSLYKNFTDSAKKWGKEYDREKIEGYISKTLDHLSTIRAKNEEISRISTEMKENKDLEQSVIDREEAEKLIKETEEKNKICSNDLHLAKMLFNKHMKEVDALSKNIKGIELVDTKIKIISDLKTIFECTLLEKADLFSKILQANIQSLLEIMLHAKRTVHVSSDFSFRVFDKYNNEARSEGQFATITFAYISAIFKLLREEEVLSSKEYPLVLDAPFSKLGEDPKQKVIDTIPTYAPQIILFSKDDIQKCFDDKVLGNVYTIISNDEQNVARVEKGFLWK